MFLSLGLVSCCLSELHQLTEGRAECQRQQEGSCGHKGLTVEEDQEERSYSKNKLWDDEIEETMSGTLCRKKESLR